MRYRFRAANFAAILTCVATMLTPGAMAFGQTLDLAPVATEALPATPAPQPDPGIAAVETPAPITQDSTPAAPAAKLSLAALVAAHGAASTADAELDCLARAVYFEAKGEPLAGQLAVADVIINRAHSGRFASTLCGVVRQRGQFSFVHGGIIPAATNAAQWRRAVGIAKVAMAELSDSPVEGALFFHARRVSPGWGKRPVASLGNHIFYR